MTIQEFCVSYNTADFQKTSLFYTEVLGFIPSVCWDRTDGRGAYFVGGGNGVVEIHGAAHGDPPYVAPPPDSFMIVLVVDDVAAYQSELRERGAEICWPMEEHEWGKYFGVADPNDIGIYFMQRIGENVAIAKAALRKAVSRVNTPT